MANETSPLNLSSSFSWPSLSGSKVKQSIPSRLTNIEKYKNKDGNDSTNETNLNTIKEASNENSAASSRKTSLAKAKGTEEQDSSTIESNWWFWNGKVREDKNISRLNEEPRSMKSEGIPETEWVSYKKMSSAISYYYNSSSFKPLNDSGENTPLIQDGNHSKGDDRCITRQESPNSTSKLAKGMMQPESEVEQSGSTFSNWVNWFGFTYNKDNSEESLEGTSDPELFKQAKVAIETSRDTSHYAFKSSSTNNNINEFELAVSSTKTENHPVKHRSKKRPITPNEAQEKGLQSSFNVSKSNGTQLALGSPRINSSNSSINNGGLELHGPDHGLVTPYIGENYRMITFLTKLRLLTNPFLCQLNSPESHIYSIPPYKVQKRTKTIKKIVIIGVHGFLPTKMVKTLIGQSTGSAVTFTHEATKAIHSWLQKHEAQDCEYDIQTISLEGEGIIEDRVNELYKLLENWRDILTSCDFLFVASHSLGTPVAIHLLAKLFEGYLNFDSYKKIGLLCMSGIFVGPTTGLNAKLVIRAYSSTENKILNELFEFQKPNSEQSIALVESMQALVNRGVKITLCGSLDDQFVPIFSSIAANFHHPNIFKCLSIDQHNDVPKFIISLLKIIIIMLNLGFSDHNLLRDLSEKCLGTVPEGGHGKIFYNEKVYLTAIEHSLETTDLVHPLELNITPTQNYKTLPNNNFHIPWNIRGLLNDFLKIKNLPSLHLINILIRDFHEWNPTQKKWKDVKYYFDAFEEVELEDLFL